MDPPVRSSILPRPFAQLLPAGRSRDAEPPPPQAGLFDLGDLLTRSRSENEAGVRALCANAYLGNGTALCRVLGRFKMFVDTADVGLSSHLLLDGYWEMWLTEVMAQVVRPGMTAVDVGANLGYFTLLMADLVGPGGRVEAFEPNPSIAARLRRSVSVNGFDDRVTIHEQPLSDEDGAEVSLVVPEGEPKNAYVLPAGETRSDAHRLVARRFDAIAGLDRADVVKIDADAAEEAIWRGMHGVLASCRPMTVFLEFSPIRYASPEAFLDAIAAYGFSLGLLDLRRGVRPASVTDVLSGPAHVDRMLVLRR